jgi:CrcB protein
MSPWVWTVVPLLGGAGAIARFVVDGAVSARVRRELPVGTLVVNLSGAVVLGLLAGLALPEDAALLAGTATIGSYTTFSTWMLETQRLTEDGDVIAAFANVVVSVIAGVAAAAAGRAVGVQL